MAPTGDPYCMLMLQQSIDRFQIGSVDQQVVRAACVFGVALCTAIDWGQTL